MAPMRPQPSTAIRIIKNPPETVIFKACDNYHCRRILLSISNVVVYC
jgi:hypothetical protein